MIRLSVNVNKIATVRNSRGGRVPSVLDAVRVCVKAGVPGITVHPRADARHITTADVHEVAAVMDAVEARLAGHGRLLVRYSGTEPLLRVMLEGRDEGELKAWGQEIVEAAKAALT